MCVYVASLSFYLGVFTGTQRVQLIRELTDVCDNLYEHCAADGCNNVDSHFTNFNFAQDSFQDSPLRSGKPAIAGDAEAGWLINEKTLPTFWLRDPAAICNPYEDWVSPSCDLGSASWEDPEWRRSCAEHKGAAWVAAMMMNARTVAFISLVFSENIRAYISRSFTNHVWVKPFANTNMQYAIGLAQMCLMVVLFVPFVKDKIIGLDGAKIGLGWVFVFIGPVGCLVLCELWKIVTKHQIKKYEAQVEEQQKRDAEHRAETQKMDAILAQTNDLPALIKNQNQKMEELERQVSKNSGAQPTSNTAQV